MRETEVGEPIYLSINLIGGAINKKKWIGKGVGQERVRGRCEDR